MPDKYLAKDDQDYKRVIIKQRNGTIVTNDYDKLGRLVNRTIQKGEDVEGTTFENFSYDGLNRLNYAENDNFVIEFKFDPLNRITEEKQRGKLLNYTYSVVNNLRRMTMKYPNDRLIEKNFDILDRLSNIKQSDNEIANLNYIGRSYRLLSKQFGNGDAVSYLYDQGRRMTEKKAVNKNSDLINHYKHGYNKVHMKNYEQRMHENGIGDVFGYDAVYRLTNAKFNVPDPTAANPTDFERERNIFLDHVDNITRIDETKNGETTQITTEIPLDTDFSKLNQYSRFDQWGLTYDKNGNLTQKGTQKMYFDFRNQAVRVTDGSSTTENKYDALGRRLQKVITTGSQPKTENYYYSGHQVIEVRDGSDQVKRQFIYGNGIDEVVRMDVYSGSTITPYYFHRNAIGSTTAITDANGQVVERYKYSLYGMPTFMDAASNVIQNSAIGNNILFQGREYEPETNFYYFRARHLDPIMGRFLQTDPMGYQDSLNLYQAFNMNPVNFVDPFGLYKFAPSERERDLNEEKKALRAWGMANIGWDYFIMQTSHDLWNVASLGTLERVESQENLGTWGGVFESTGNATTRVSNTLTLGLQDEIYYTQMEEGAGLKNIVKGTGKGLLNITPYEEVKTIFSSDSDAGQKISSFFMGISKLASLVGLYKSLKTPTNPKSQNLENFQSREWYLKQEKLIHKNIDESLPIREKSMKAFKKRNEIRTKSRDSMADVNEANRLNIKDPNMTLKEIVKKYYDKGFVGDKLWKKIFDSAIKSRASVNIKMQIEKIYHILFFSSFLKE